MINRFVDTSLDFIKVIGVVPRAATTRYPIRSAADTLEPTFSVAIRAAFSVARKKLPNAKATVAALEGALGRVLEPLLRKAIGAGGEAASRTLRVAAFDPDQPRDERGRWTDGSTIFHGSTKDFDEFDATKVGSTTDEGWLGKGVYFSTDQRVSDYYPLRYETQVLLKNPLRIKEQSFRDDKRVIVREALNLPENASVDDVTTALVKQGYDGVVLDYRPTGYLASEVMVLDPKVSAKILKKVETGNTKMWDERAFGRPDKYRTFSEAVRTAARKPLTMRFDAKNPRIAKWAKQHAAELVTLIADVTRERLQRAVERHAEGELDDADYVQALEDAVGDPVRAQTIARTESMKAVHQGQREAWDQAIDEGLIASDTKRVWITTADDRLCPICEPLDGEEADLDGEYVSGIEGPPAHPNCMLPGTQVSGRIVAGLEASYSGPAVEIKTIRGHILRVTPNHRVLTGNGWIAALEIRNGMELFSQRSEIGDTSSLREVDNYQCPAFVENIVQTLRLHGLSSTKVCRLDLHGDARWIDGDVDIVGVDRELRDGGPPSVTQERSDFRFPRADMIQPVVVGLGSTDLNLERVALAAPSRPTSLHLSDDSSAIQLQYTPLDFLLLGRASQWDVCISEAAREDVSVNAAFVLELEKRSAGQISRDQVVEVRNFEFSGQVYELQSDIGWIIAQNIVISNCRCTEGLA